MGGAQGVGAGVPTFAAMSETEWFAWHMELDTL